MSDENIARRGLMLVLSSPSGAGKTTLSRRLLQSDPDIVMSVSATTRAPRPNEIDGQDYFFVSPDRFNAMIAAGEFLEHATVFGHKYGTPRAPVMAALEAGKDVLFDIDWQGTQQLKQQARDDLASVFVVPPSKAELERRLRIRAQDSEAVVRERMAKANDELSHWAEYDYLLLNDDIQHAMGKLEEILRVERSRRTRQPGLARLVQDMMHQD
ncbi:MAG TPA: guanylate kinase [Rhizomicrobium sp.]|jgi:guanylate kinase|nr:guanylate kinase [Rhizomicrobium sp.]